MKDNSDLLVDYAIFNDFYTYEEDEKLNHELI